MVAAAPTQSQSFTRPQTGPFVLGLYRAVLEQVLEGKVFTLTVSTGDNERVFFFTRGAILFLATGSSGCEVLARKIQAKRRSAKYSALATNATGAGTA